VSLSIFIAEACNGLVYFLAYMGKRDPGEKLENAVPHLLARVALTLPRQAVESLFSSEEFLFGAIRA
jgi:hypothetical protein